MVLMADSEMAVYPAPLGQMTFIPRSAMTTRIRAHLPTPVPVGRAVKQLAGEPGDRAVAVEMAVAAAVEPEEQ
jgi:hypothetical protein